MKMEVSSPTEVINPLKLAIKRSSKILGNTKDGFKHHDLNFRLYNVLFLGF